PQLRGVLFPDLHQDTPLRPPGYLAGPLQYLLPALDVPDDVPATRALRVPLQALLCVLKASREVLRDLRRRAEDEELLVVDFTDAAQTSKTYADYERKIAAVSTGQLNYLGVAFYGARRPVNRLTGSLPLLR
ncbi:MAG: DUF2000 domain-containing protein, partial [Actinomycetota bacterium]|nr:DUF2000 domain-containing protein [Actinomycetota bacterium]